MKVRREKMKRTFQNRAFYTRELKEKTWDGICSIAPCRCWTRKIKNVFFFHSWRSFLLFTFHPHSRMLKQALQHHSKLKFRSINKNSEFARFKLQKFVKNALQSERSSARYVIGVTNLGKLICLLAFCKADVSGVARQPKLSSTWRCSKLTPKRAKTHFITSDSLLET